MPNSQNMVAGALAASLIPCRMVSISKAAETNPAPPASACEACPACSTVLLVPCTPASALEKVGADAEAMGLAWAGGASAVARRARSRRTALDPDWGLTGAPLPVLRATSVLTPMAGVDP